MATSSCLASTEFKQLICIWKAACLVAKDVTSQILCQLSLVKLKKIIILCWLLIKSCLDFLFILKMPLSFLDFLFNEKLKGNTTLEIFLCLYMFSLPVGFQFLIFKYLCHRYIFTKEGTVERKNVDVFY